ncbi:MULTISPECIES: DUF485 domain-containing protein [unclassified Pseudoclavibacter]|uniref:DUF485 domain-containing protein n=1 Tax=unclassified Pseudoclavibacter TaxID=2615177 RepID=UPI001787BA56|nr:MULTISPECIES: DUF485 domain-containing protein [unclassified Pseudoclavibacter]
MANKEFVDTRRGEIDYIAVQASPEFISLKKKHRRFVLPVLLVALIWYFGFVIVAITQPKLMATPVFGHVNLGIILGLAQFVTTFAITMWYVSFANRKLDPDSEHLRAELTAAEQTVTAGKGE